jgi:hypothetical protein
MLKEWWVKFWTPNVKRWVFSTLITFLTGFGISFVATMQTIDVGSVTGNFWFGVLFACVRAGLKAVFEGWQVYRRKDA